jgi:predicted RNA-binding protein with PIN domain
MVVVIDGYNLLKQVWPGIKTSMEKQREHFIAELSYFKKQKPDISEIVVVFDAGPMTHATREIKKGIVVVFSGIKSSADDWIIHFVERNKIKEILVVTLDRELAKSCKSHGADVLGVFDFYEILQHNLMEKASQGQEIRLATDFEKYENRGATANNTALDLLMQQASINVPLKKDDKNYSRTTPRNKGYTPSKKEKMLDKKLKKLF